MQSKETAFEDMLLLIDELESKKEELKIIEEKMANLRKYTAVGDLVVFPNSPGPSSGKVFREVTIEIENIIGIRSNVEKILENIKLQEDSEIEYEIGCVVKARFVTRAKRKGNSINYELDVNGTGDYYSEGEKFIVIDNLDGRNYVLIQNSYSSNPSLIFANKSQLDTLMEKIDIKMSRSVTRIEFTINGPDATKYADTLTKFRFYKAPCPDREKSDYYFDGSYCNETRYMNVTYDEVFGIMGTVYVLGAKTDKFESIVTVWSDLDTGMNSNGKFRKSKFDANKIGFHRKTDELYEYSSSISYFVPNNYPKDVFTSSRSKDKTINILSSTLTYEGEKNEN